MTILIYLNENYTGGQTLINTRYDHKSEIITITPKTGQALCFGKDIKHSGEVVLEGTKYILKADVLFKRMGLEKSITSAVERALGPPD